MIEQNELLGIVSVTDILIKGHPGASLRDELSQRIQEALQHAQEKGMDIMTELSTLLVIPAL